MSSNKYFREWEKSNGKQKQKYIVSQASSNSSSRLLENLSNDIDRLDRTIDKIKTEEKAQKIFNSGCNFHQQLMHQQQMMHHQSIQQQMMHQQSIHQQMMQQQMMQQQMMQQQMMQQQMMQQPIVGTVFVPITNVGYYVLDGKILL